MQTKRNARSGKGRKQERKLERRRRGEAARFASNLRALVAHLRVAAGPLPGVDRKEVLLLACLVCMVRAKSTYRDWSSYLKGNEAALKASGLKRAPCKSSLHDAAKRWAGRTGALQEILLWQAGRRAAGTLIADSTGFAISRNRDWHSAKYGDQRVKDFAKLHVLMAPDMTVVACMVTAGGGGDAPAARAMLARVPDGDGYLIGDKGYDSNGIHDDAAASGRIAIVMPRENAVARGYCARATMIRLYRGKRRRWFDRIYHTRSRVESLFSSMKRRLGSNVAAFSLPMQRLLLSLKCVCRNLAQ